MIDLGAFQDKFSESGRRVMRRAIEESRHRDHNLIGPEHIFAALIEVERSLFNEVMQSLNLDPQAVIRAVNEQLSIDRQFTGRGMKVSHSVQTILQYALQRARQLGRSEIDSSDLLVAIFQDRESVPVDVMRRLGADPEVVLQKILTKVRTREEREERFRRRY